jgi:hypothetical protein
MYPNLNTDDIQTITDFFHSVDTNKDNFISVSEITNAMSATDPATGIVYDNSQEWLSVYFVAEDFNHDQLLTLNELLQYNNDKKGQTAV